MDETNNCKLSQAALAAEQLYQQALGYLALEQLSETRRLLEELITQYPSHALAHSDLGALSFQEGQLVRAREYLERAIALDPDDEDIKSNLAEVYKACGEESKAEKLLSPKYGVDAALLSIIALCRGDGIEVQHLLRSLAQQLSGRFSGVKVLLLQPPGLAPVTRNLYELNLTLQTVPDADLPQTVLNLFEAETAGFVAILREGYSLAPGALEQAVESLELDSTLAAVASADQEPDPQERLTIADCTYRTFREQHAGLLVMRKSMLHLCRPCLEQNLHNVEWLCKAALAAFSVLNLEVRTDLRIIAWPLRPRAEQPQNNTIVWHADLLKSLQQLLSGIMDPQNVTAAASAAR